MKKWILFFCNAILLLAGCGRFGNNDTHNGKNQRIVCLSKQLTEMMFALGKGSSLVAVDLSSTYPDSAKLLKTVGYHRALSAESIIAMAPDLVIHSNDIGPENVLPQITRAGLQVHAFGGANTIDSARLLLAALGAYFQVQDKAAAVIQEMDKGLARAADSLKAMHLQDSVKVMIIHFGLRNNNYFVMSGRNGAGDQMIRLAGARPALYDGKAAREMSAEAVAVANPDIIIATDYGFDKMGSMDKFIATVPGVALTNAGKNKRIVRFEEHDLVYFGPRSGSNIITLQKLLYPGQHAAQ
ncbi:MAG TPA: ABC transporter substrate-binding protein [Chitinophagaceae bacterium]|nr:ABC transporter substrate-binding protein [Chitinophagaceae bacterium]